MSNPVPPELRQQKCARCRKHPVLADYRPFCSKRCADADLGSWLKGNYTIAGSPAEDTEDATSSRPRDLDDDS